MADFLYDSTERMDTTPPATEGIGVFISPVLGSGEEAQVKVTRMGVSLVARIYDGVVPLHSADMEVKEQTRGVIENLDRVIAYLQRQRLRLADELNRLEAGGAEEILEEAERRQAKVR